MLKITMTMMLIGFIVLSECQPGNGCGDGSDGSRDGGRRGGRFGGDVEVMDRELEGLAVDVLMGVNNQELAVKVEVEFL
ncbi:unnamed protein product [Oppiella nova]|uniref:Uncharacterized protein n=1 Tax=Oppiella nova TaxID=334625 RepID=A0A7R9MNM3_9ACAR|nr:unnamed protein product [Oppiella nova]CAG2180804.1 unnamed protein product [Oppiella nova]